MSYHPLVVLLSQKFYTYFFVCVYSVCIYLCTCARGGVGTRALTCMWRSQDSLTQESVLSFYHVVSKN